MTQRICPICDRVMTHPHFCTYCKKYIKNPWIRNVTYYLNESRPGEGDRETEKEMQPAPPRAPKPQPQGLSPFHVLLFVVGLAFIVEVFTLLGEYLGPAGGDPPFYEDAEARGGISSLTDDEVIRAGVPCTEMAHFNLAAVSLLDDLNTIFKEQGLNVNDISTDSFNQIYGDGGSWYETLITFSLDVPGEDTGYQRLTLNYDTANGALHEIDIFISDEDRFLALTGALIEMLCDHLPLLGDTSCEEILAELRQFADLGEDSYAVYENPDGVRELALFLYCYDEGYSMYISRE